MYLDFFGFKEPPFRLSPDPKFFFFSEKHEEAFSHILYGVKEGNGFIVITGEVGTGKTTLCHLLLSKLEPSIRTALLFNTQLSTLELLQGINQAFGLKWRSRSKKVLLEELHRFVAEVATKGGQALLIIDEAQLLSVECLEEIRLLSNLETEKNKLIQILLIGQPELGDKLAMNQLRQLKQRISLLCEVKPLDRKEVGAYIQSRIRVASEEDTVLFNPKGIDHIYRFSNGLPRLINTVADRALLAAYVSNKRSVSETHVEQAISELEGKEEAPTAIPLIKRISLNWLIGNKKVLLGGFLALSLLLLVSVLFFRTSEQETPTPNVMTSPELSFDLERVFRVEDVSGTGKGAYITLLNLWNPILDESRWRQEGMEDIFKWMEEKKFRSYSVPLELKKILSLNYPLLFSLQEGTHLHYQVLAKIRGEEAVVLDPLEGRKNVPLSELTQKWRGTGIILWKEMERVRLPLSMTGIDPSVSAIQEALRKEGLFLNPVDGIWGPPVVRALSFFQQKAGLEENGFFGPETYLVLAKKSNKESPSLQ